MREMTTLMTDHNDQWQKKEMSQDRKMAHQANKHLKVEKETPNDEKKYTTNDKQKNGIMDEK